MNIKKDRIKIAEIIKNNLSLMNNNNFMCQEVADAIIVYLIEINESSNKRRKLKQKIKGEKE